MSSKNVLRKVSHQNLTRMILRAPVWFIGHLYPCPEEKLLHTGCGMINGQTLVSNSQFAFRSTNERKVREKDHFFKTHTTYSAMQSTAKF